MTNAELNARAAEIMGWRQTFRHSVSSDPCWVNYEDSDGRFVINFRDWNPLKDSNQLKMVLLKVRERVPDFETIHSNPKYILAACVAAAEAKNA